MEIIWTTKKVVDERDVITHIEWSARAWEGVRSASKDGRVELAAANEDLVIAYHKRPTPQEAKRGLAWEDMPDPPGFVRPEWVQRDLLEKWLFAHVDRAEIEREITAEVQTKQVL